MDMSRDCTHEHHWTVEDVSSIDRASLVAWACDMCRGLDVEVAAEAMNVAPNANAVVEALTDSLPRGIRKEVAKVCFEELGTTSGSKR
jgi:hypothetical protein